MEICKLCFSVNYHGMHEFIMRPSPDKDWEPAFRESQEDGDEQKS